MYDGASVQQLKNGFVENGDHTVERASSEATADYRMGEEVEFFTDMREHTDITWQTGANVNVDIVPLGFLPIPIPIPSNWPAVSKITSQLKTVVTNKVIFRAGILERVESFIEGSLTEQQHLRWDKLTGQPVLTRVNNDFDDVVYSYSIPAYTQYAAMGPAYQNIGYRFGIQGVQITPFKEDIYRFTLSEAARGDLMLPGDEWILYALSSGEVLGRGIYIGEEEGEMRFYTEDELTANNFEVKIVRSGNRNQLAVQAESIQALQDPTQGGTSKSYPSTLTTTQN